MNKPTADSVRAKTQEFLTAPLLYYKDPLVVERAKGLLVTDIDGREYLDFFGGILTVSIGHCDDRINAAIQVQNDRLQHISTLYPTVPIVELAERLAGLTPGNLKKSFFTSSGTEADETAVMLAMSHTGRSEIIALRHGYSGRSMLAQSLMGHSPWRVLPTQVPGIKHAHSPYCYRCPFGLQYPSCEVRCASDIEELIRTTTTGQIAGFLAEPIQGVGGFIVPPAEYFEIAVDIVRRYGGLFIADEVQTGFGRSGGKMWGIEHYNVVPDIITMAKGIANGLPLGATVCTDEIAGSLKGLTISTFGGNPVSSTAALATLDVIEEDDIVGRSERLGKVLHEGLRALQERYPVIGDVRGKGLMQAIELVVDEPNGDRTPNSAATGQLFEATKERGLLIGKGGLYGNIVRIAPPMSVTKAQIAEALRILGDAFEAM